MAAKSRKRRKASAQQQHNVTAGTTIRMESASSERKPKPNAAVVMVREVREINPVEGFIGFLREYTVVGLAIGFVIGTQAQTLMKLLVASFLDPAFQLLFGQALSSRTATLHWHGRSANFNWGDFAYGLLNFLFVLAAIYAVVKIFKLDKLNKKTDEAEEEDEE